MIAELSTFLGVVALIALSPALRPIHAWWTHPYRAWTRECRRADHRYTLRADSSCRVTTARRGSADPDGEPQPAPGTQIPSAGSNLQSGLSRLEQGRRRDHSSEQPQPASETTHSGAGPIPPRARLAARHEEPQPPVNSVACDPADHRVDREGTPADTDQLGSVSAGATKRPAAVAPPDAAAAGLPTPSDPIAVWRGEAGPSAVTTDGSVRGVA